MCNDMGRKPRVQAEVLCSLAFSDGDDRVYLVCALTFILMRPALPVVVFEAGSYVTQAGL